MGKLTTHVLDTANGKPAAGVAIELYGIVAGARLMLVRATTNSDGRIDSPLLQDYKFQAGIYELDFHVGDYFAALGANLPQPRFLDVVTLRIGIHDASAHYHVPLLASPFAYSTYRGS
ncbi:5-hydroxyisourate hydrolase [Tahibacter aquaticus]|uniref:5-hydroxyisourate hydrolase n=1 Tax=Tahibacter aquaticus TaxID=520092 RepID=A0A4R6YMT8_9GAMM|nr:hydroxyisourate hydrolase [Tahibacter aquaticus]TDR38721.1 5-hydroxyisourate hydrolase [Tahibacter aquaticus]